MTARVVVLASGAGTLLQTVIDSAGSGALDATIVAVVSDVPDAQALDRARAAGIPAIACRPADFPDRGAWNLALLAAVRDVSPDWVVSAGFMRILTPNFILPFSGRLLNVHPSLLPRYPGLNTHQRALDAGDREAGVTVHFVTLELDGGPPIVQARVPILPGDTAQTLADRVIVQEHRIYPLAAQWVLSGRLRLTEQGACLDGEPIPATGIDYSPQTA